MQALLAQNTSPGNSKCKPCDIEMEGDNERERERETEREREREEMERDENISMHEKVR